MNIEKTPRDFAKGMPYMSVLQNDADGYECEILANNIMKCMSHLGNAWHKLSYEKYKKWAMVNHATPLDTITENRFKRVVDHCKSAQSAMTFCNNWI